MSNNNAIAFQQGLDTAINSIGDFSKQTNINNKLSLAFGDSFNTIQGIEIIESLPNNLPNIEILETSELNNASGAFSIDTNTTAVCTSI